MINANKLINAPVSGLYLLVVFSRPIKSIIGGAIDGSEAPDNGDFCVVDSNSCNRSGSVRTTVFSTRTGSTEISIFFKVSYFEMNARRSRASRLFG